MLRSVCSLEADSTDVDPGRRKHGFPWWPVLSAGQPGDWSCLTWVCVRYVTVFWLAVPVGRWGQCGWWRWRPLWGLCSWSGVLQGASGVSEGWGWCALICVFLWVSGRHSFVYIVVSEWFLLEGLQAENCSNQCGRWFCLWSVKSLISLNSLTQILHAFTAIDFL